MTDQIEQPVAVQISMEPTELTEVLVRFASGEARPEEISDALDKSVLFARRGDEIGFQAIGFPDFGWVPLYSCLGRLVATEGPSSWFSAPAAQMLAMVPEGYGVVLDLEAPHETRLPEWALERSVDASVDGD